MKLVSNLNNRLCIYFFYDPEGIIDNYVFTMIKEMQKYVKDLLVVVNGMLSENSEDKLKEKKIQYIIRKNVGFDVWAYKDGIDYYGFEKICTYDELIMMNFTICGPLYSFKEMFDKMDKCDIDFWGITTHHKVNYDPFHVIEYGYIPKHIQSHFISVRNSLLKQKVFQEYWNNMRMINSYEEAIGCHEAIFTKKFSDYGYKWKAYIDSSDLAKIDVYPLMFLPTQMIIDKKCPIFKRKSFLLEYGDLVYHSFGEKNIELLSILKQLNYDYSSLLKHLMRTGNIATIQNNLNLVNIIPDKRIDNNILNSVSVHIVIKIGNAVVLKVFEELYTYIKGYDVSVFISDKLLKQVDTYEYKNCKFFDISIFNLGRINEFNKEKYCLFLLFDNLDGFKNNMELYEYVKYNYLTMISSIDSIDKIFSFEFVKLVSPRDTCQTKFNIDDKHYIYLKNLQLIRRELKYMGYKLSCNSNVPYYPESGCFIVKSDILDLLAEKFKLIYEISKNKYIPYLMIPYILQANSFMNSYMVTESNLKSQLSLGILGKNYGNNECDCKNTEIKVTSSIYYYINTYSEKYKSVKVNTINLEENELTFKLEYDCNRFRFDLLEYKGLALYSSQFYINDRDITPIIGNFYKFNNIDLFTNGDPFYEFEGKFKGGDIFKIKYDEIKIYDYKDFIPIIKDKKLFFGDSLSEIINDLYKNYNSNAVKCKRTPLYKKIRRKIIPKKIRQSILNIINK